MATRLVDVITTMSEADLYKRQASGFNTSIINLELQRRGLPLKRKANRPVKSTVSRGRGHARRAVRPSGGRVDLSEVIVGTLRPKLEGSHVPPWIRHAKV